MPAWPRTECPAHVLKTALSLGLVLTLGALIGRAAPATPAGDALTRINGRTMGTTFAVAVAPPLSPADEGNLRSAIQRRLDQLEAAMSTYLPASDISRFNAHPGNDWFAVTPETAAVVAHAQRISAATAGAFDITVYPLVCLWGFGPDPAPPEPPSAAAIAQVLRRVDYRALEVRLSPPALRKQKPDLAIDLSGIAKGFAGGEVAQVVERKGRTNYVITIGGEIRVRGGRPGHRTWRIGLERPDPEGAKVDRVLELTDTALSTSGDYRNFFDHDQRRYSHLIDPRTGRPVSGSLGSVAVLATDSAEADALATALMVLGETAGFAWAQQHNLAGVFFVRDQSGIRPRATPAFTARTDPVVPPAESR